MSADDDNDEPRCRKCKRTIDELADAGVDCDFEVFAECEECDPGGASGEEVPYAR